MTAHYCCCLSSLALALLTALGRNFTTCFSLIIITDCHCTAPARSVSHQSVQSVIEIKTSFHSEQSFSKSFVYTWGHVGAWALTLSALGRCCQIGMRQDIMAITFYLFLVFIVQGKMWSKERRLLIQRSCFSKLLWQSEMLRRKGRWQVPGVSPGWWLQNMLH